MDVEDIKDEIQEKVKWYITYRTTIWGTIWFLVGMCGGNVDRIKEYTASTTLDAQQINIRLDKLEQEVFGVKNNAENNK